MDEMDAHLSGLLQSFATKNQLKQIIEEAPDDAVMVVATMSRGPKSRKFTWAGSGKPYEMTFVVQHVLKRLMLDEHREI